MPARVRFRIKICGVRRREDIVASAMAGADAVGLNFYPPSVRYLDPAEPSTERLAAAARTEGLLPIGVFVNEDRERILRAADRHQLAAVQLHGDETLDIAATLLGDVPVIRAIRLPTSDLTIEQIESRVAPWRELGVTLLLDADAGAHFGGEGQRLDWTAIGSWSQANPGEWMLAGGLAPASVAKAVTLAKPLGIDVASGVEQPKGVKDARLIQDFCYAAQKCMPPLTGEN